MKLGAAFVLTFLNIALSWTQSPPHPHILFIVADDLGWNDVSWHNPEMITPNLENLARSGVILNRSYVQPMCSPSRSAIMTGLYPFHTGLQHFVILSDQGSGVPLNVTMLPQVLREKGGYSAHIVGKWHLGFCRWEYTPLRRGFESFTGYYTGMEDYYTREMGDDVYHGYDFRENETVSYADKGTHSGYTFTQRAINVIEAHDSTKPLFLYLAFQNVHEPLEVPSFYSDLYKHIDDENRRTFCGMVTMLDDAVGNVTKVLKERGMLEDTLIVFTTDNGGPTYRSANNWPLRGAKTTLWEGGTRGAGFITGPPALIPLRGYTSNNLMHAVDWLPTLLELAGLNVSIVQDLSYALDGVSQADALQHNVSARSEFVYNIDDVDQNAAIRFENYKLIVGYPGNYSGWYPPPLLVNDEKSTALRYEDANALETSQCVNDVLGRWIVKEKDSSMIDLEMMPDPELRLYDVEKDPAEKCEISQQHPELVQKLLAKLADYKKTLVPAQNPPANPKADPKNWNGAWSPGWC